MYVEKRRPFKPDLNNATSSVTRWLDQRTLTIGGCITVRLTSCLTGLNSTNQVKLLLIQHKQEVSRTEILPLNLVLPGRLFPPYLPIYKK